MKLKKIFASAVAAVAAITSVASLTSCKKDDDVTDDGGNDQGGNENDAAAEIQAKLEAAIKGLSVKSSYEADFTLPTTAAGGVTISWASDNVNVVKIENGKATITRPGLTEADATVKITATAVIDGETKVKEFTVTIPHVADESKTIAVIKGLEAGAKTAAKGIVTGFAYNEKNDITVRSGFYLTDGTDTIYVFGKNAAAELSIGDEVYLNAEKSIYYGAHQLSYPSDVVKLGENKTPTYANIITDKTITELATAPKPGDNETTNQGKVYELLAYFEKSGTSSYVNYRVVDPYNTANYLNVYFTATVVPGETYEFTEAYEAYAGKYCKVKFYMAGTNSSGKWRGHILGFEDLTEAESAKMLLVQATSNVSSSMAVPASGSEVELSSITLPTGTSLVVTSDSNYVTYADNKLKFTRPAENTTANIKFEIKLGETVVAEYTKTVEIIVEPVDITSLVTIENGYITIPYTAITSDGEFYITLETGKVINITWNRFVDTSSKSEFSVGAGGSIAISATGVKLDAVITDVYGSYDNIKAYAGADTTGTAVTAVKGQGQGTTYSYVFAAAADKAYLDNPSNYKVDFYKLQLVVEGSYVAPAEPEVIESTIANAITIGSASASDVYTKDYYKLTGTITEIQSETYGNMMISDGTNSILIYGLYDANGTRYDAMATKPVVGDTIVVQGVLGNFNGTVQIKNGTLISLSKPGVSDEDLAEEEALKLAELIGDLYEDPAEINFTSTLGTVTVTPQAGATTLVVDGTKLTITPAATEITETITITVTVGEKSFTTEPINVKSKAFAVSEGNFSATLGNPESSISSSNVNTTTDYAADLGLRDNLFSVYCAKNDGSTMTYLQYTETRLYWDASQNGNGSTIKVAVEEMAGYTLSISSIVVKYSGADNTGTVTANEKVITGTANDLEYTYEFEGVNEFVIQNTNTTNVQVKIKSIVINYTVTKNDPVEYTVDLTKTEFNLKNEATMPTVEYDVYASVWGGTEPTGTFIPVDADGKFDVVGSFTGVTLVLIKKGQEAAWSGDNFLAQTIDYTVEGTTVLAPFDGTEDYVEYTLDVSKIQYNLSTETTLPAEYDVYVTVWGGTEPTGTFIPVTLNGSFEVLGTFTNATVLLIVKGETPAWEGAAFIAKTKDYTLTDTTIAGPFDGTEVAVAYEVDLFATKYNLKNDATMPTVEYDVYATVWGGTATTGTFIPVTLNGSFEVLGTFTNASLILIAKDQTPAWSGDNFLAQTTDYTVSENTLVAPIGSPVTHAEYVAAEVGDTLTIKGVITRIKTSDNKSFWLADEAGAYQVFSNSAITADWLVVGNEVVLNGQKALNNNQLQITSPTYLETISTDNNVVTTNITDEIAQNGFALTNETQSQLVTVEATVTSTSSKTLSVGGQTVAYYTSCSIPDFFVDGASVIITGITGVYKANSQIYIVATNDIVDNRTDEEKAEDELDRLVALFAETYNQTTEIDLTSTVGTVVVTPQVGATTLAVDGTKLTVTPGSTDATETVTISVTVGEATKTSNTISIKTVNSLAGEYSSTLQYIPATGLSSALYISKNAAEFEESLLGLDSNIFTVVNNGTVKDVALNYGSGGYIRMYNEKATTGNGSEFTISINDQTGYNCVITSIDITFTKDKNGTFTINGTAGSYDNGHYDINSKSVIIKNADTGTSTANMDILSIVINYTITEATA